MKVLVIAKEICCAESILTKLDDNGFQCVELETLYSFYEYIKGNKEPFILITEIITSLDIDFRIIRSTLSNPYFHGLLIASRHSEDIVYSIKCYLQELNFVNVNSVKCSDQSHVLTNKINTLIKNKARVVTPQKNLQPFQPPSIEEILTVDNIYPYCQPQVSSFDESVVGYEILSRLKLNKTIYPPNEFIPTLVREGEITNYTYRLIEKTLKMFSNISKFSGRLSFNVDYQSLSKQEFAEKVLKIAKESNFLPDRLVIEVTENDSIINANVISNLAKFRIMGCGVSIDDFGMNRSGFTELLKLPFTEIKIDRSFIQDIVTSDRAFELVKALSMVANSLGDSIVAEGIETQEQKDKLRTLQINSLQGYLYGKPFPVKELVTQVHLDTDYFYQRQDLPLEQEGFQGT